MAELVSIPEWGKMRGISKVRAYNLIKQRGIPTVGNPKKVDPVIANRMVSQNRDVKATLNMIKGGGKVPEDLFEDTSGAGEGTVVMQPGAVGPMGSMADAQRTLTWERAKIEELKRREMEGQLLNRDDVETEWAGHIAAVQSRLLMFSDKMAPQVARMTDVIEIKELMERELRNAMEELAESA